MKKLFVALTFMLYAGLNAQTFDFTCSGTQGPWSHTPGNVTIDGDGFTAIYNTTVIGNEYTFNFVEDSDALETGVSLSDWGTGISNGDYFIVKYSDDDFVIIQGHEITAAGVFPVSDDRTFFNDGFTWVNRSGPLTIGKIADPTIVEDFTHTPGTFESGGYVFNTATSSEERFEFVPFEQVVRDVGDWRLDRADSNRIFFYVNPSDIANYPLDGYVVLKQQDVTGVEDVWIGKIGQTDVNAGDENGNLLAKRVRIDPIHQPSSWSLSENKPIQLGIIANPTPSFTYGHVGEAEYQAGDYAFDTRVSATDQFDLNRIAQAHAAGANSANTLRNRWAVGLHMDSADFWVDQDKGYNNDDFIIIKDAENNVSIGRLWAKSLQYGLHRFRFEVIHGNFDTDDITGGVITIGKLADPIDFPVNLRVEIAQPYEGNYSAVEYVTIRDDADSQDDGSNQRLLFNTQIDINDPRPSHSFEENHPISWFDDATTIDLWPRNNSDTPNTQATRTEFTFSPPTSPVDGETYTYKYFARDGGYDIANAHLRGLPFHFELDNDIPIQGISLTSAFSINTTLDFILITLNRTSDSNLVNVGDKVLIVYGDFLMEGTVHDKPSNGFIEVRRVRGHAYNGFGVINTRGQSPKLYVLK